MTVVAFIGLWSISNNFIYGENQKKLWNSASERSIPVCFWIVSFGNIRKVYYNTALMS